MSKDLLPITNRAVGLNRSQLSRALGGKTFPTAVNYHGARLTPILAAVSIYLDIPVKGFKGVVSKQAVGRDSDSN